VAESIGATLGMIAAKAGSVQKELAKRVTAAKPQARRAVTKAAKRGKTAKKTRAASTARRTKKKS
jgi:hypothetical protein